MVIFFRVSLIDDIRDLYVVKDFLKACFRYFVL